LEHKAGVGKYVVIGMGNGI